MPESTIAANFHEPFYIKVNLFSEFTFNHVFLIYYLTNAVDFILSQTVGLDFIADPQPVKDFFTQGRSNTIDILQRYPYLFVSGNIYT